MFELNIFDRGEYAGMPIRDQLSALGNASLELVDAMCSDSYGKGKHKLCKAYEKYHPMRCSAFDELYRSAMFSVHRIRNKNVVLSEDDVRTLLDVAYEVKCLDVDDVTDWRHRILAVLGVEDGGCEDDLLF